MVNLFEHFGVHGILLVFMVTFKNLKQIIFSLLIMSFVLTLSSRAEPKKLGGPELSLAKKNSKRLTPITGIQLLRVLRDSHVEHFGYNPSVNRLAMAWSQVALENGQGKFLWNHNIGNIGPGSSEHEYYIHSDYTSYRSFSGFGAGGVAYWKTIGRSQMILRQFDQGDPASTAISLRNSGYYGADLEQYSQGMIGLYGYAKHKIIPAERNAARAAGQRD